MLCPEAARPAQAGSWGPEPGAEEDGLGLGQPPAPRIPQTSRKILSPRGAFAPKPTGSELGLPTAQGLRRTSSEPTGLSAGLFVPRAQLRSSLEDPLSPRGELSLGRRCGHGTFALPAHAPLLVPDVGAM